MENSKHTKGPWSVDKIDWSDERITISSTDKSIADVLSGYSKNEMTNEEAEANAKLIAAAPDLLEACIWAIRIKQLWAAHNIDMHIAEQHAGEMNALIEMENKLNAAIQKATS